MKFLRVIQETTGGRHIQVQHQRYKSIAKKIHEYSIKDTRVYTQEN